MDELDEKLQDLARAYHEPPTPPRERMWERIEAQRAREAAAATPDVLPFRPRPAITVRRWAAWAAAAAAVLFLGIAIGRGTSRSASEEMAQAAAPVPTLEAPAPTPGTNVALDAAVRAHLRQSEAYLTLFRASVRNGETGELAVSTARELLASNRFLVSAPGTDPRMRALMLDLEVVLVGIAQLQAAERPGDIKLITDGLDEAGMLTRLRSATPRDPRPYPSGVL